MPHRDASQSEAEWAEESLKGLIQVTGSWKNRSSLTIWLVILLWPLLAGCGEVLNEYYLSNHTDNDLTIELTPFYPETVELQSGPLIEEIERSARSSLPQPVNFTQTGEVIQFTMPAHTSVFLGISTGGTDLFSRLEVSSTDRQIVMDDSNYHDHFSVHDHFVGAVVHVFNVK